MLLSAGTRLGSYEILAPLGAGGMGEVYRARDTNLERDVAIKVLPQALAQDPERLTRFKREAKVLASLNHPHIAQIYGVEATALVMELVEGEAPKGPLPWKTALDYARQIAEALEAAHEKGIIHRDLKPANIKVTPEGVVKVLDFGLAAVAPGSVSDSDPTKSPTITMAATQAGVIMGTAAYMSPEQAAGKPVDKRADIWSFGVVLWELLAGRRLFEGETVSHTLADVLRGPIDLDVLPQETPAAVRGLLGRCLERNAKNRLRDIGEARIAIESALAGESPAAEGIGESGGGRQIRLAWGVAGALAVGLAAVAFLHFRERPPLPAAPVRFQIAALEDGLGFPSPDGRNLAYLRGGRLLVYVLESGESHDLTAAASGVPLWSPDSHFIGYLYERKIWKIEATGGTPQAVVEYNGLWGGGAWNQDDLIVYGDRRVGLFRVPAAGGVPVQITALDPARHENSQYCPSFLPDGKHFVYIRGSTDEGKSAIYVGSLDARPEQQSTKPLVVTNSQPVYAPSAEPDMGYLLFVQGTRLMAQAFDNRRLELKGQAVALADQVRNRLAGSTYIGFSASATVLGFPRNSLAQSQAIWQDREGNQVGKVGEPAYHSLLVISPDGTRLAGARLGVGADSQNLWLVDMARGGASTRFTFSSLVDNNPIWSPEGNWIVFSSNREGPYNLYRKAANGVQPEEILLKSGEDKFATSWSRDGRFLLYEVDHPKTGSDLWLLPLEGDRKPVPFLVTEFNEGAARFSPDGRWVAYTSNESGKSEVYVRSFTMNSARTAVEARGKWKVSDGVGGAPRWRGDGRELYYGSRGKIMAVEIAPGPEFRAGRPQALGAQGIQGWEVTPDGKRFLTLESTGKQEPMTFVMNWQSGLPK